MLQLSQIEKEAFVVELLVTQQHHDDDPLARYSLARQLSKV